ncbi:MAG TPA: SufD family Fe-S cluster assembly protein [Steroidobacteraceae bacterium]|nr:SufD family Fe-S cluster assembly protein [Steroidobacteraceae bacterium]
MLPTNRDENWRYANLRPLARARPEAAPALQDHSIELPATLPGYERWVFLDGHFQPALSSPSAESCATLLNARDAGQGFDEILDAALATEGVDFALARINGARGDSVLHIAPADGAEAAIELTYLASAAAPAGTSYPRVQVHAGRGAKLRLVERHLSAGTADSVVNSAFDVALRADATLDHCRLQACAEGAASFDTLIAHVGERAGYRLRSVALGGVASRSTILVRLAGRGARCDYTAAGIANGNQSHDVFAEIEHAAPETVTRELYRGIATGRGKLGFNGKMIVRDTAPGADSEQSLKTLLTGLGAEAAVRPQLEIYTDRVRAVHGATTGKLDEQMLFYLLSRGLEPRDARALLQWAFIEDAVSRVDCGGLRQEIERLVAAQLHEVSALGDVRGAGGAP